MGAMRILVQDGGKYFRYGKVDLMDGGNGLLLWLDTAAEKTSRHADGRVYTRPVGLAAQVPATLRVPFSDIRHEVVRSVAIPSNLTHIAKPFRGSTTSAFAFSSTVLGSGSSFAAELVDDTELAPILAAWKHHPAVVSAQTWRPTGTGKHVILTVLHAPSTGSQGTA